MTVFQLVVQCILLTTALVSQVSTADDSVGISKRSLQTNPDHPIHDLSTPLAWWMKGELCRERDDVFDTNIYGMFEKDVSLAKWNALSHEIRAVTNDIAAVFHENIDNYKKGLKYIMNDDQPAHWSEELNKKRLSAWWKGSVKTIMEKMEGD